MLNLADRGFFSMDRFLRFSGTGAHLACASRTARSPSPSRPSRPCPTALSWSCCTNRTACAPAQARHREPARGTAPGHHRPARHLHRHRHTRSGRTKTTRMRADHSPGLQRLPGPGDRRPVCREMANRNRVPSPEADRPRPRRPLRGQSPNSPARKPALLLIHNITATAPPALPDPPGSPRAHPVHRRPRPHPVPRRRGHLLPALRHRPANADDTLASLNAAILAIPRHRTGRQRTSGRTTANAHPTPKKSPTPSTSRSRISRNGT